MRKYVFLLVLYFFVFPVAYAQNGATASAIIVTDIIGATQFKSMNFGNIQRTAKDQSLNSALLNNNAASFTVISNSVYFITLPTDDILLIGKNTAYTMKVGSFNIASAVNDAYTKGQLVAIGATLSLNALQQPGNYYNNNSIAVTINYN